MGFRFEDITDEFLSKVAFYGFQHPSGFGDTAGSITMIAEDGREYFIAGEGFELDYRDWGEAFPVFDDADACGPDGRPSGSGGGAWRTYQVPFGFAVIRKELAGEFARRGGYGRGGCGGCGGIFPEAAAAEAMGFDADECHENRIVYDKTLAHWARERRERALARAARERVALGPGDVEWREIPPRLGAEHAGPGGCFAALHRRNSDGTFFTSLWSIEYQLDTDMATTPESRAGLYNLYYEKWVRSPAPVACEIVDEATYIEHRRERDRHAGSAGGEGEGEPEPVREIADERYFTESGARFVRSFPTLQAAKEGAMRRCACGLGWGGHTKENLVDGEGAFVFTTAEREEYAYDLGERPHPAICGKAADNWLVRMRDEETGEVVELVWDHAELSAAVCEVPMSSEIPTFGSLLSIDPLIEEGELH